MSEASNHDDQQQQRRDSFGAFMKARRLKVAPWAREAKVSPSAVYNYLSTRDSRTRDLSTDILQKLATAAGITVDEMLGGAAPPGESSASAPSSSHDTRADFATRLHTVRLRFTSAALFCKAAGLPAKRYRALSDGDADPSLDELIGISKAAGVSLDYLVLGLLPRPGFREESSPAHPPPTLHSGPPA